MGGSYRPNYDRTDNGLPENRRPDQVRHSWQAPVDGAQNQSVSVPSARAHTSNGQGRANVDCWKPPMGQGYYGSFPPTNSYFNQTALPFQPLNRKHQSIPQASFTRYQPLRIPHGVGETQLVGPSRPPPPAGTTTQARAYSSRYPTAYHSAHSADQPIPTVEREDFISLNQQRAFDNVRQKYAPRKSTPRRTPARGTVSPPPAPEATNVYLAQARLPPIPRTDPQKLLVVLDLNGTLLYRPKRNNPTNFKARPGVTEFLRYLFDNHMVMVYTSARPQNAGPMVDKLLDSSRREQLVSIWARDKLDLTPDQYREKVQVYKKLDKIWKDTQIQSRHPGARHAGGRQGQGRGWDQTNTVLIDDSHLKALAQPHNLIQVPEYTGNKGNRMKTEVAEDLERQTLKTLELKLEALKHQSDVSRLLFQWQTGKAEPPRLPVRQVLRGASTVVTAVAEKEPAHLPTPESPDYNDQKEVIEISSDDSGDSDVQRDLARQMAELRANQRPPALKAGAANYSTSKNQSERRQKSVSPIPEGIWREILEPDGTKSIRWVVTRSRNLVDGF